MKILPDWIKNGYLRLIDPVADWFVRRRVHPNTITVIGTLCTVAGGVIYGTGHIRTAGWFLGLTALFDVLDGTVARRSGRSSTFGAFLDSTLDRIQEGVVLAAVGAHFASTCDEVAVAATIVAVLGVLATFYALNPAHRSVPMMIVCMLGLIGAFLTSYTRARAEALGIDAKVGLLQRPERVTLLSAPQAFFGLALNGWVLGLIIVILTVTAWVTVVQRIVFVYHATQSDTDARLTRDTPGVPLWMRRKRPAPRPALKGE
jgi:CDP-diacylglycerol---glycerol-3-phosphate 3-phosphatidyltransferase